MTTTARGVRANRQVADRHLTIMDLCEELDISRSTFYEWRTKRIAPRCFKLPNGEIRVRRSDLENWIESREEAA
jgi:predicted DNA-binding transcriptional regulator AlpA